MKTARSLLIVLAGVLIFAVAVHAHDTEKQITQKSVPAPVMAAFHKAYPNAKAKEFAKEVEGGKTFYEIECVDGKVHRDVLFSPDGTMEVSEEVITMAAVPTPVQTAVSRAFPAGKPQRAEKITHKDNRVEYEIVVKEKSVMTELVLNPDGTIVKKEVKHGREED